VHVPRLVVISSSVIPSVIDFLMALVLAAGAVLWYVVRSHTLYLDITWRTPIYVGGGIVLMVLLGVGLGLLFAVAGARARDVRFMMGYALSFIYYLTPIIYSFQQIPNGAKPFAELNPLVGAVELFKTGLFSTEQVSVNALIVTLVAVVVIWGPGLWLFHRQEVSEW
jgi:ABC-type polysaccharide/polyol phosphate export permease